MTNTTITRDELQAAIQNGDVIVVEALGRQYYDDAHLPGAINIPHTEVARLAPQLLPDKAAAIVTYCSNSACRNSEIVAAQLRALGYLNVRKYAEGKEDWRDAGLPSRSAAWVTRDHR
jgi:rhodanese-related sulfurtransferase